MTTKQQKALTEFVALHDVVLNWQSLAYDRAVGREAKDLEKQLSEYQKRLAALRETL